jgi:L-asparaginase/Glu-tRNA(Gln) amidotransferase subunit D
MVQSANDYRSHKINFLSHLSPVRLNDQLDSVLFTNLVGFANMLPQINQAPVRIKKVLVLYVGGTIGMERNENHVYSPSPNKFLEKLKFNSQMHDPYLVKKYMKNIAPNQLVLPEIGDDVVLYELKEYSPLLDSSNMSSKDWIRIAEDVEVSLAPTKYSHLRFVTFRLIITIMMDL